MLALPGRRAGHPHEREGSGGGAQGQGGENKSNDDVIDADYKDVN